MRNIYIKAVTLIFLSILLSGCALYVRDGDYDHHHYRYRHWRGSLDAPSQATTQLALNHGGDRLDRSTTPVH